MGGLGGGGATRRHRGRIAALPSKEGVVGCRLWHPMKTAKESKYQCQTQSLPQKRRRTHKVGEQSTHARLTQRTPYGSIDVYDKNCMQSS
ncbi:hypothetical protein Sjap_004351 [Stephania japonica]|uniref:Uncharacterized protein n=1 Tax=Stephania japonica TaxID=461633 RepID=A0AAP0K247_9MAGN